MKKLLACGSALAIMFAAQVSRADFVNQISAGAATTALGLGASPTDNGSLTFRDFTNPIPTVPASAFPPASQVNNDNYAGPGALNPNQVVLSLTIFALGAPVEVRIETKPATSVPPAGDVLGAAEYFFTVNVTNMLNANGVDPADAGKEINTLQVDLVKLSGPLTGADLDAPSFDPFPVATGGSAFPLGFATILSPTSLLFEGGGIGFGQTATLRFSLDLPAGSSIDPPSIFALRFTANPEPGTMALAGLALGAGGWFVRRRRQGEAAKA